MAKSTEINLTESFAVILMGLKKRNKMTTAKAVVIGSLLCFSILNKLVQQVFQILLFSADL